MSHAANIGPTSNAIFIYSLGFNVMVGIPSSAYYSSTSLINKVKALWFQRKLSNLNLTENQKEELVEKLKTTTRQAEDDLQRATVFFISACPGVGPWFAIKYASSIEHKKIF